VSMQLHVLALLIEPAHNLFQLIEPRVSPTQISEKNVFGTKLVTDLAHLGHPGRPLRKSPPDQTINMVIRSALGQRLCIDRNHCVAIPHTCVSTCSKLTVRERRILPRACRSKNSAVVITS